MYYYRPRSGSKSTTRTRPAVSRERLRQEQPAHQPITETPERDEPPGAAPAAGIPDQQAQAVPVLDTHTLLLVLMLLERLAQAEGKESLSPPFMETEHLVVESIPPEEEGQDGQDPPSRPLLTHRLPVVLLALCVLVCLAVMAVSLVPLITASATVTIIPVQREITASTTLSVVTSGTTEKIAHQQVSGRRLSSLALSQAETVPTTGRGLQQARPAHGMLTFYNALPQVQNIPSGTLLTSTSGIQIVTEQDAVIPAGTGAVNGEASVTAHAIEVGPQGNIAAGTITGPCCRAYVLVTNRSPFEGGQDARSFPMVLPQDLSGAALGLKTSLSQSVQAALQAQVHPDETLITPVPCTPTVTSSHAAGEEAVQVTVTVEETCSGETYVTQALHAQITQVVTRQATAQLGSGYALVGDVQVTVRPGTLTHQQQQQGTLTLQVSGTGTWAYQFDDVHLQQMAHLIAGKSRAQATQLLLHQPGVSQVSVTVSSGTGSPTSVPADASRIHLLVFYRTV